MKQVVVLSPAKPEEICHILQQYTPLLKTPCHREIQGIPLLFQETGQNTEQSLFLVNIDTPPQKALQGPLQTITYGLNSKATITASSIHPERALICVQRCFEDIHGNRIEPQEFTVSKKCQDMELCLAAVSIGLVCLGKSLFHQSYSAQFPHRI